MASKIMIYFIQEYNRAAYKIQQPPNDMKFLTRVLLLCLLVPQCFKSGICIGFAYSMFLVIRICSYLQEYTNHFVQLQQNNMALPSSVLTFQCVLFYWLHSFERPILLRYMLLPLLLHCNIAPSSSYSLLAVWLHLPFFLLKDQIRYKAHPVHVFMRIPGSCASYSDLYQDN